MTKAVIPSEAHEARVRVVEGSPTIATMPSAHVVRRAEVGMEIPRLRALVPRALRSG
ncbi:MAG: hypothetical protein LBF67_02770 [Prevotellaceae bacterium]|nr:hypothetical protein [Prevotellaceae bacterium]